MLLSGSLENGHYSVMKQMGTCLPNERRGTNSSSIEGVMGFRLASRFPKKIPQAPASGTDVARQLNKNIASYLALLIRQGFPEEAISRLPAGLE